MSIEYSLMSKGIMWTISMREVLSENYILDHYIAFFSFNVEEKDVSTPTTLKIEKYIMLIMVQCWPIQRL